MAAATTEYPTVDTLVADAMAFERKQFIVNGYDANSAKQATAEGGERWMTARMCANGLGILFANNRAQEDQNMADTAVGLQLARMCDVHGIPTSPGAGAIGPVIVTCTGVTTYPAGQEATSDRTQKRYRTTAVFTVSSGQPVTLIGIDVGEDTNLEPGEKLTWTSPPGTSASACVVGGAGLEFGANADTESTLRKKLKKKLAKPQEGGSWAHVRRWIEEATASVEAAYVYPAAQGPNTSHAAYTVVGNRKNNYARAGTSELTASILAAVLAQEPEQSNFILTTVAESNLSVVFKLTLPNPVTENGAGGGWIDKTTSRWPPALAGGAVKVTTVVSSSSFQTNSTTVPVDGAWIQIFDSTARELLLARITSHSGSSGSYTINLDRALSTILAGDHISPASERGEVYAESYMADVAKLAPGEKTSSAVVLPRAYRHPRSIDGFPSAITTVALSKMQTTHSEIVDATYFAINDTTAYALPVEPAVATLVTDAPNVWRPKHIAFYPA